LTDVKKKNDQEDMKALLIIDMQRGAFEPMDARYDAEGVIERINQLASKFRVLGLPVIFIQHDGSREGFFIPGTNEWEILQELDRRSHDLVVVKTANDAFYRTNLHSVLKEKGVDELVITGCSTDFSVDCTVKAALSHDYLITVISNGHTTRSRPQMTAMLAVDYFNLLWGKLAPAKAKIRLQTCDEFLKSLM
jgi:nicotinamidase-related amidase